MPKKTVDTAALMEKILSSPVPREGQLKHPLRSDSKPERKAGQVSLGEIEEAAKIREKFPADVRTWNVRTFVDYFAFRYMAETGGNYRRTYRTDSHSFTQIGNWLVSNGLDRNEWTKKLLDWAFDHRLEVTKRLGHFTPVEILKMVNYFYQEEVLPGVEKGIIERDTRDTSLLDEINRADEEGRATLIFSRFGIPIAVTYFVRQRGFDEAAILEALEKRIANLWRNGGEGQKQLCQMVEASLFQSPYPKGFLALDWRERFADYLKEFRSEKWWREYDYRGKPLPKHYMLLQESDEPGQNTG